MVFITISVQALNVWYPLGYRDKTFDSFLNYREFYEVGFVHHKSKIK